MTNTFLSIWSSVYYHFALNVLYLDRDMDLGTTWYAWGREFSRISNIGYFLRFRSWIGSVTVLNMKNILEMLIFYYLNKSNRTTMRPLGIQRVIQKKVYHDLDHLEKCGFLHSVQHVLNNIFKVFYRHCKFLTIFAVFHGNFWKTKISSCLK